MTPLCLGCGAVPCGCDARREAYRAAAAARRQPPTLTRPRPRGLSGRYRLVRIQEEQT